MNLLDSCGLPPEKWSPIQHATEAIKRIPFFTAGPVNAARTVLDYPVNLQAAACNNSLSAFSFPITRQGQCPLDCLVGAVKLGARPQARSASGRKCWLIIYNHGMD